MSTPYRKVGPFYLDPRRAKVERAVEHLGQLDAEMSDYARVDHITHRIHFDLHSNPPPKQSYFALRIEVVEALPWMRLSLIISDVLQNLRSALDYVAWHLALIKANGQQPRRPREVYFPIALTEPDFDRLSSLAYFTDAHRARLKRFQPYQRGNRTQAETHPLAILNGLARVDRHRILHPIATALNEFLLGDIEPEDCEIESTERAERGLPLDDGAEVARVYIRETGPSPNMKMKGGLVIHIQFEKGVDLPVMETLQEIGPYVLKVIGAFDPDFEQVPGLVASLLPPQV